MNVAGNAKLCVINFGRFFFFILTPPPLVSLLENGAAAAPLLVHFRRIFFSMNQVHSRFFYNMKQTIDIFIQWDKIRKKAI